MAEPQPRDTMSQEPITKRTSVSRVEESADPEGEFLTLLNNRGKIMPDAGVARNLGFAALASGASSLQSLQALSVRERQPFNTCFTARYRLGPGPVIGTLIASFLYDLRTLEQRGNHEPLRTLRGDLVPAAGTDAGESPWSLFLAHEPLMAIVRKAVPDASPPVGSLTTELIDELMAALGDERLLRTGHRLVLFCELTGEFEFFPTQEAGLETDQFAVVSVWRAAQKQLIDELPERMGIVFGFPAPTPSALRQLPLAGGPHQRLLSFSGLPTPVSDRVQRFKPSALAGDYPAARDDLGLAQEAAAIARLILHPQTDPMTISIEAPWGKGKSSFLNFVGRALTEIASDRVDPSLGQELKLVQDRAAALDRERVQLARPATEETEAEREVREEQLQAAEARWLQTGADEQRVWGLMDRAAQDEVLQVRFNAWRHQDARHIWAGLLSEVSKAVEGSLPTSTRWTAPLLHAFDSRRGELFAGVVLPTVLAAVAAIVLTILGVGADPSGEDVPFILKILLPGSAVAVLLAWRLYRVIQPVSQRVLDYVRLPDYRDQLGFQEQVLEDLGFLRNLLRGRRLRRKGSRLSTERKDPRIVVFIDDLDRCSDDRIMEVLQTVNLVLVQSAKPAERKESKGAFVLLAVDTDKIHQAIVHHYLKEGAGTADTHFAQNYLRKIIQLPYYLPDPSAGRGLALIENLFSPGARAVSDGAAPATGEKASSETPVAMETEGMFRVDPTTVVSPRVQVLTEVEDTEAELDTFRKLKDFLPDNPREMKRLLNVHRFVKILLQHPESPTDERRQRMLVAWLIFCARWEDLVDDVIADATETAELKPGADCIASLEAAKALGGEWEKIERFRLAVASEKPSMVLTAGDLVRDGFLAQAAIRTRLVQWVPERDRDESAVEDPAGEHQRVSGSGKKA